MNQTVMPTSTGQHSNEFFYSIAPLRYPREYGWLIIVSTLDLVMTWFIITMKGGSEANPVANVVLTTWGYWGLITYKFALMIFVVIVCEVVGRQRDRTARWLARFGVAISAIPFFVACYLIYVSDAVAVAG